MNRDDRDDRFWLLFGLIAPGVVLLALAVKWLIEAVLL